MQEYVRQVQKRILCSINNVVAQVDWHGHVGYNGLQSSLPSTLQLRPDGNQWTTFLNRSGLSHAVPGWLLLHSIACSVPCLMTHLRCPRAHHSHLSKE